MNKKLSVGVVLGTLIVLGVLIGIVFNRNLITDTNNQLASVIGPTITNIKVSNITATGAIVTWTTSKASSTSVETKENFLSVWVVAPYNVGNINGLTTHKAIITDLKSNTKYSYRVTSCDSTNSCKTSSSNSFTTIKAIDTTAPSTPTDLVTTNITDTTATISWSASTDNVAVAGYNIYKNGSTIASNSSLITTTSYLATGLIAGTSRTYAVSAVDATGNMSARSTEFTFTTTGGVLATDTCPNAVTNPSDARDVWAWHSNTQLVTPNSTYQNQFFAFADSHKVKTIYLNANPSFLSGSSANNIKDFLNKAKTHCMDVEALGGAENWVATPGNPYFTKGVTTTAAVDFANAVKNFNNSIVSPNAKFSAIQLDVEPHTISSTDGYYPYWNMADATYTKEQSNIAIANALIDMLHEVRGVVGTSVKINLAPPRWYDTNATLQSFNRTGAGITGKNAMQYMFDEVDTITLQDYVTTADSIYTYAKGELDYAVANGKKVKIGLLLDQDTSAPTSTYYGSTCTKLNTDIASSYAMMTSAQKAVFDGYAIEQYDTSAGYPSSWSSFCPQ